MRGGEHGTAVTSGEAASSRIIQYMRGGLKPAMPPEDEPQLTQAEIDLIKWWIDSGAKQDQTMSHEEAPDAVLPFLVSGYRLLEKPIATEESPTENSPEE